MHLYTKKVKGVVITTLLGGLTHLDYDCNIMVGAAMEFKNGADYGPAWQAAHELAKQAGKQPPPALPTLYNLVPSVGFKGSHAKVDNRA
ncbi:hypothetical protein HaLaN_23219 [Haematococcus lacustris]|uniref:Uncharacterized protein n=1 Tax=Haematococcus lacustris TaxID=44745 RepID=A0A699ZSE0_HAELA|nr:hypothetical protein HaLaN_23219 [Haematococcus lacustris]